MGNSVSGLRTTYKSWGRTIQLSADGAPKHKTAGVTVDWATVPAAVAAYTLEDGVQVAIGEKVIRYGTILARQSNGLFGMIGGTPAAAATIPAANALVIGETFAVNETVKESDVNSNHPPCIQGGTIFMDRLVTDTVAAASTAVTGIPAQPTLAAIKTAIPNFTYAYN